MEKNRFLPICIAVLFVSQGIAQYAMPKHHDSLYFQKQELEMFGLFDLSSNSLNRDFTSAFLFGGYIPHDLKNTNFARLKSSENLFGLDLSFGAEYRNANLNVISDRFGLQVKVKNSTYVSGTFSKDLFGLLMYGNELYEDDAAQLNGTGFKQVSFQKIGVGLFDKKSKTSASLNVYNISGLTDLFVRTGEVYTAPQGDSLVFDLDGYFSTTSGSAFSKGFGLGIDFEYRIPVVWFKGETAYFSAEVQDLGIMHVANRTAYSMDTTLSVSGFAIQELQQASNIQREEILDSLGIKEFNVNTTRLLPVYLQFSKLVDENNTNRFQSFFGVRLYASMHYQPLFFYGQQWRINENMHWAIQTHYGGYSAWRFGSYFRAKLNQVDLAIGSEDLMGFVTGTGYGRSIMLKLRKSW